MRNAMNILFFTALLCSFSFCSSHEIEESRNKSEISSYFSIAGNTEYRPIVDTKSLLRNPCCGWGLYDDAAGEVADADSYWQKQDYAARKYASFFYLRWRWSDMEPEEGKYAWIYNENYKKLIKGALDRGLKLAFRVYYNGQDNLRLATPNFVKKTGAKGYATTPNGHWTPYIDDPVFQQKLNNFVKAFATEYDNPDMVDFVDGANVGHWGECNGLEIQNITKEKSDAFLNWITQLYGTNFKKVILIMPVNSQFTHESELNIAAKKQGYGFRRDGLGSMWFSNYEKEVVSKLYPKHLLIGESCYWAGDDSDNLWFDDAIYHFKNWKQIYEATYKDAVDYHYNTLDLRTPTETKRWISRAPELVQKFIEKGGYRLYPSLLSIPDEWTMNQSVTIGHQWKNLATGIFPNENTRWNGKYKIAFALMDKNGKIEEIFVDTKANPAELLIGKEVDYKFKVKVKNVQPGHYMLSVAIVDQSKNNEASIQLATLEKKVGNWVVISNVTVK